MKTRINFISGNKAYDQNKETKAEIWNQLTGSNKSYDQGKETVLKSGINLPVVTNPRIKVIDDVKRRPMPSAPVMLEDASYQFGCESVAGTIWQSVSFTSSLVCPRVHYYHRYSVMLRASLFGTIRKQSSTVKLILPRRLLDLRKESNTSGRQVVLYFHTEVVTV